MALGASIDIAGPKGSRSIPLEEFYRIPQKQGEREHDLAPDEIVVCLKLPPPGRDHHLVLRSSTKARIRLARGDRHRFTLTKSENVTSASVVLGHVAPIPWRSKEAEAALIGKAIDERVAAAASEAALQPARNLGQNGYKIQIARVALKRAILQAAGVNCPSIIPEEFDREGASDAVSCRTV